LVRAAKSIVSAAARLNRPLEDIRVKRRAIAAVTEAQDDQPFDALTFQTVAVDVRTTAATRRYPASARIADRSPWAISLVHEVGRHS